MHWIERWESIAARIDGLFDAAKFVAQTMETATAQIEKVKGCTMRTLV
jgi:hypothetical protein